MASGSRGGLPVDQEGVGSILDARWHGISIQRTSRLNQCRFKLSWVKFDKHYERYLQVGDNDIVNDWLYQGNKLKIEISRNGRSSNFTIQTLPGFIKDPQYANEDLSITLASEIVSSTPYEYFYLCPWALQDNERWLRIYETHLDLRLNSQDGDRGIDIDWKYPFTKWLGGYGEPIPGSIQNRPNTFTATLGIVKEYGWPEGFTVWLKTPSTNEERINGEKEVNIALSETPQLVIKKWGKPVALIWPQDEGSWDLGVCWNVDQTRAGNVKHVYRPPFDDEGNKHDLYVSPSWVTLYNYPHTGTIFGSNRGIAADISKDLGIWMT